MPTAVQMAGNIIDT